MLPESISSFAPAAALETRDPSIVSGGHASHGDITLIVGATRILEACRLLKDEQGFIRLSSVTAVDWFPAEPRFEIVYHLHSIEKHLRLRLKCKVSGETPEIDSVTPVWNGANWYEREVFDLFGVRFRNHPDLRRLLMPDDWEGHPLRKDYPVHGFKYSYKD